MDSYGIIYKITNELNGKVYIGQTIQTLEARKKQHERDCPHRDYLIYRAFRKHGIEHFLYEKIDEAQNLEELNEKEIYWIDHYEAFGDGGYNMTSGGEKKWKVSAETREKMSKARRGKKHGPLTDEQKKNISNGRKGKGCGAGNIFSGGLPKDILEKSAAKHRKKVQCIETGEIFESVHAANIYITGSSEGNVSYACRNPKATLIGYHWRYYTEESCPSCGSTNLVYKEGCVTCNDCQWARCG